MVRPRLVVIEGPDVGAEFEIPEDGGAIGRGSESIVRLTDLSVSRRHCALEPRGDRLVIVDPGSRNRTLVNGRTVSEHALSEGDEIEVGKSRLAFLPAHKRPPAGRGAGAALPKLYDTADDLGPAGRRTLEALATQILTREALPGEARGRERRHLRALYQLGEGIRRASNRRDLARAACEAVALALATGRAVLSFADSTGALSTAATFPDEPGAAVEAVPRDLADKVLRERKAVLKEEGGRLVLAAPVSSADGDEAPVGLLYAEARGSGGEAELELLVCVAHLVAVALEGLGARESLTRENRALVDRLGTPEFTAKGPRARAVVDFVTKVAASDATVLVLGESGVGKELVAAAIHRQSKRARGPFVCVNCAALTESVLESELFGHERGAFTGAVETKIGRFELAHGGTLFLDEVGEIPARCQAKFLRALEDRRIERVGGTRSIPVDVRVVAATNRDLEQMTSVGEFRSDLYFRLGVLQTRVPSLRERPEDIPAICEQLLTRLAAHAGKRGLSLTPAALSALQRYSWPGNVRELRNALEHAVVLGEGPAIDARDLPPHVVQRAAATAPAPSGAPKSLRDLEREGIVVALAATGGNKAAAAALLEIDRSTLYKKMRDYDIATSDG